MVYEDLLVRIGRDARVELIVALVAEVALTPVKVGGIYGHFLGYLAPVPSICQSFHDVVREVAFATCKCVTFLT